MHVCMASDFFYPSTGGVEAHIWHLGQRLLDLGHEVIVITHAYGDRVGVKYMQNGLKVYYLSYLLYPRQNIKWPFIFNTFPAIRKILIAEQIHIVHGHSAFSPMAHEVMFHAKTLGINTVFTDHSLFGFNYFGSTLHNFIVRQSLMQCNHIICVSHAGKRNEALQLEVEIDSKIPISVIPNAVDTLLFTPDPSKRDPSRITIIVNSRLVYRKGIDILAALLPKLCELNTKVHMIIAGDGPKKVLLEEAVQQHNLEERVTFLGPVQHSEVRDILVRGDIFLNTSLIEAFCMAIVEAASCGLQVVSTNVGGLPEVLPPELIKLTEPTVGGLLAGVEAAIEDLELKRFVKPIAAHNIIEKNFSWLDIAKRTEKVYRSVMRESVLSLEDRFKRYKRFGLAGSLFFVLILINHMLLIIYDWFSPHERIDDRYPCVSVEESRRTKTTTSLTMPVRQTNGVNYSLNLKSNGLSNGRANGHVNGDIPNHYVTSCDKRSSLIADRVKLY